MKTRLIVAVTIIVAASITMAGILYYRHKGAAKTTPTNSQKIQLGDPQPVVNNNDKTASVNSGQVLTVQLPGTGWKFNESSNTAVLKLSGQTSIANAQVAGSSTKGETVATFRAVKSGTAKISAASGNQSYTITVTVK